MEETARAARLETLTSQVHSIHLSPQIDWDCPQLREVCGGPVRRTHHAEAGRSQNPHVLVLFIRWQDDCKPARVGQ